MVTIKIATKMPEVLVSHFERFIDDVRTHRRDPAFADEIRGFILPQEELLTTLEYCFGTIHATHGIQAYRLLQSALPGEMEFPFVTKESCREIVTMLGYDRHRGGGRLLDPQTVEIVGDLMADRNEGYSRFMDVADNQGNSFGVESVATVYCALDHQMKKERSLVGQRG